MRSVAGSNGIRKGDISSSSRSALVMPPGEKAALFYHRLDDVCGVVTDLLKDSIRQGEMCVFMFRTPLATLKEMVKARGLDLDAQPSIVLVPISKAPIDSYNRSSIGEQMGTFVQQAKGLGYSGARLILNVPEELSAQVPSEGTWQELDQVREELGMTVVCLYDMIVLSPSFLLRSLSSYPKVIMDGALCRNFYYVPSMALSAEGRLPRSLRTIGEHQGGAGPPRERGTRTFQADGDEPRAAGGDGAAADGGVRAAEGGE